MKFIMKKFNIYTVCIILLFQTIIKVQSQDILKDGGRVNVYVIPFNVHLHRFSAPDINFIRVEAMYKISITENYTIKQFRETFFDNTDDSITSLNRNLQPQIVIDFIWNEKIRETIVFDKKGFYEKLDVYKPNKEMLAFLEQFFPSWIVKFEKEE